MSHLLVPFIIMIEGSYSLSCESYPGMYTSIADDVISTKSCPTNGNYTTLVSCGFEPKYYAEDHVDGGWMEDDSCKAKNGGGQGVRAWARCCDFSDWGQLAQSSTFFGEDGDDSVITGDDGIATSACSLGQTLTGCSVSSAWSHFDGAYPGNKVPSDAQSGQDYPFDSNNCTAQHGYNGQLSIGNRQCLQTPAAHFSCVLRYSDSTPNTGPYQVTIACSPGHTMLGCSAWGWFNSMNGMWINEAGECIASSHDANKKVYGIAICCRFDQTPQPSEKPTSNPTLAPTDNPTPSSTNNPTQGPTDKPTQVPTLQPTPTPTNNPSSEPTESPTIDPTMRPTMEPTIDPTFDPTSKPTLAPSFKGNTSELIIDDPTRAGSVSTSWLNFGNILVFILIAEFAVGGIIICSCIVVICLYIKHKKPSKSTRTNSSQNDRDKTQQSDVPNKEYLQVNNNSTDCRAVHLRHGNNPNDENRDNKDIQSIAAMGINTGYNDHDQDKHVNDGIEMHQI